MILTMEGTFLGTVQYMSPEQVECKTDDIDARTDIFSFGAVVYEMATGKKAFEGENQASVMAKILEANPPSMASSQPVTPPALDHLVRRCLAKDPDERWQTASDLYQQLKWIAEGGSRVASLPAAPAKGISALWRPLVVGLGALLLGAARLFAEEVGDRGDELVALLEHRQVAAFFEHDDARVLDVRPEVLGVARRDEAVGLAPIRPASALCYTALDPAAAG